MTASSCLYDSSCLLYSKVVFSLGSIKFSCLEPHTLNHEYVRIIFLSGAKRSGAQRSAAERSGANARIINTNGRYKFTKPVSVQDALLPSASGGKDKHPSILLFWGLREIDLMEPSFKNVEVESTWCSIINMLLQSYVKLFVTIKKTSLFYVDKITYFPTLTL